MTFMHKFCWVIVLKYTRIMLHIHQPTDALLAWPGLAWPQFFVVVQILFCYMLNSVTIHFHLRSRLLKPFRPTRINLIGMRILQYSFNSSVYAFGITLYVCECGKNSNGIFRMDRLLQFVKTTMTTNTSMDGSYEGDNGSSSNGMMAATKSLSRNKIPAATLPIQPIHRHRHAK